MDFAGKSLIVACEGNVVAKAGAEECLIVKELDLSRVKECRKKRPYLGLVKEEYHTVNHDLTIELKNSILNLFVLTPKGLWFLREKAERFCAGLLWAGKLFRVRTGLFIYLACKNDHETVFAYHERRL